MEFLEMRFFDDDFFKLLFRFCLDFTFLFIVVKVVYFRVSQDKEYVFSFIMINILVFMICFTLKKFELQLGMALGLFALFGILRYRTDAIPIREMTYLFVVIGIAVINSLANKKMSYAEILLTNGLICVTVYSLEHILKHGKEVKKKVTYERIELIHPNRRTELIADISNRTGLIVKRLEVGNVDFLRDTAQITFYYDRASEAELTKQSSSLPVQEMATVDQ